MIETGNWYPGSFTKNFSWGSTAEGLKRLHESIRVGFNNTMEDTPRDVFRARVSVLHRPDFIPMNFFLFNEQRNGVNFLVADELVFQALSFEHNHSFDKLALFAFLFSYAGNWSGANSNQRRPALWAHYYIIERLSQDLNWDTSKISSNDIEKFIVNDRRYKAQGARKVATNFAYLLKNGKIDDFREKTVEIWWVNAVFLALDRVIKNRRLEKLPIENSRFFDYIITAHFAEIAGKRSISKDLALKHLIALYDACGADQRFSDVAVSERRLTLLGQISNFLLDLSPLPVVHPSNPKIIKTIPSACAMLATYSGFERLDLEELENFNLQEFVRRRVSTALEKLKDEDIYPSMSVDELMKLVRG